MSSPTTAIWRQSRVITTRTPSMLHIIIFVFNTVTLSWKRLHLHSKYSASSIYRPDRPRLSLTTDKWTKQISDNGNKLICTHPIRWDGVEAAARSFFYIGSYNGCSHQTTSSSWRLCDDAVAGIQVEVAPSAVLVVSGSRQHTESWRLATGNLKLKTGNWQQVHNIH